MSLMHDANMKTVDNFICVKNYAPRPRTFETKHAKFYLELTIMKTLIITVIKLLIMKIRCWIF